MIKKFLKLILLFSSIVLFSFVIVLWHNNRIMIDIPNFYIFNKDGHLKQKNEFYDAKLVWIDMQNKKNSENVQIQNLDKIITETTLLIKFSKFIMQEKNINVKFSHAAINKSHCIINFENNLPKEIMDSALLSWNFFESIIFTLQSLNSKIKNFYFFRGNEPLECPHFYMEAFKKPNYIDRNEQESQNYNRKTYQKSYSVVPLFFEKNGKNLKTCYEYGFFQKLSLENKNIVLIKDLALSSEWIKKLNKLDSEKIIFINIVPNTINQIAIIENDQDQSMLKPITSPKIKISQTENNFTDCKNYAKNFCEENQYNFLNANIPLKVIYLSQVPSMLIECFIKNSDELENVSEFLKNLCEKQIKIN